MSESKLSKTRRNLPHWTLDGSMYYVTFRLLDGDLSRRERELVLNHVMSGIGRFYLLAAAVVMPDHVHLLLKPETGYDVSRVMKGIKDVSARLLNQARNTSGSIWQEESWDRIMRDQAEFEEKLQYMADNPVKAGLVKTLEEYDAWYCAGDLI